MDRWRDKRYAGDLEQVESAQTWLPPETVNLVVHHAPCLDGAVAAALGTIATNAFTVGIPAGAKPAVWHSLFRKYARGRCVLVVDVAPPMEALDAFQHADKVAVLDHHSSSQLALADTPGCFFGSEMSGASLALHYFLGCLKTPVILPLIECVEDSDVWRNCGGAMRNIFCSLALTLDRYAPGKTSKSAQAEALRTLLAPMQRGQHVTLMGTPIDWGTIVRGADWARNAVNLTAGCLMQTVRVVHLPETSTFPSARYPPPAVFVIQAKRHIGAAEHLAMSEVAEKLGSSRNIPVVFITRLTDEALVCTVRSRATCKIHALVIAASCGGGGHTHAAGMRIEHCHPWAKVMCEY